MFHIFHSYPAWGDPVSLRMLDGSAYVQPAYYRIQKQYRSCRGCNRQISRVVKER